MKFSWEGGGTGGLSQNALILIKFQLEFNEIQLGGREDGRAKPNALDGGGRSGNAW